MNEPEPIYGLIAGESIGESDAVGELTGIGAIAGESIGESDATAELCE